VQAGGTHAEYVELDSPHGHDAFLLEADQVGRAVGRFLDEVEKSDA
jgi:homoserine O-acetyltransferase